MKKYFVFMRKTSDFSPQDVVYHVSVGITTRDYSALSKVVEMCQNSGYYLSVVCDDSDAFVSYAHKVAFRGRSFFSVNFRQASVSIQQLRSMIMDGSFPSFENSLYIDTNLDYFLHQNDPLWRLNHQSIVLQRSCSPAQRKNLSLRTRTLSQQVANLKGVA